MIAHPGPADRLIVGRPYPPLDHTADAFGAQMLIADRRLWWLDAAEGYLTATAQARDAGETGSARLFLHDARRCLHNSRALIPVEAA